VDSPQVSGAPSGSAGSDGRPDRYRWIALSNTTLRTYVPHIKAVLR